ncbi:hypothetical protein APHAL10511_008500 [Amanita phalloides]|nr:hypothetical protein APHAL10511_008500 [Amanita phalloides]
MHSSDLVEFITIESNRSDRLDETQATDADDNDQKMQLNTPGNLGQGIIQTNKNQSKEFTILLVGETGTGKTSFLSLLANIAVGHKPDEFMNFHDDSIEAGGGPRHSQTNMAKVYEFTSVNGIKVIILDTPGLADTRGLAQDEVHKASIASAIKGSITTVNAVIILANGTVPRLGVATDYALSTLSSIFPRTLADNIGILFTNVSSPLSWNFDQNSLPDVLRGKEDNQWLLDNPLAMWNKYVQICARPNVSRRVSKSLLKAVGEGHQKALEELSTLFDWIDGLKPQPTNDIMNLFEQSQQIDRDIENAMSRATNISEKKKKVAELKQLANGSELTMKQYENYKSVIMSQVWVQKSMSYHSTLCSQPNCHSNCHDGCNLSFSLDPNIFLRCFAMSGGHACLQCGHSYDRHRHYNALWKQEEHRQESVDRDAEEKYNKAKKEKNNHETMIVDLDKVISDLDQELGEVLTSLGWLTESYAKLSLSGSFAGQVKKSVRLLEANVEAMRRNGADQKSIEMVETSLENMKQKLRVVEEANERAKANVGKPNDSVLSRINAKAKKYLQQSFGV